MPTQQVNIRMEEEFIEELKEVAEKYRFRSHNDAARDILETYLEFWVELQEAKRLFFEEQRSRVSKSEKRLAG